MTSSFLLARLLAVAFVFLAATVEGGRRLLVWITTATAMVTVVEQDHAADHTHWLLRFLARVRQRPIPLLLVSP